MQIIGVDFIGKDIIIGFDIYKLKKFNILLDGIRSKKFFKPFIDLPKIYLQTTQNQIETFQAHIIHQSCAQDHNDFLIKCTKPLWKDPDFFIRLLFKKNEDINPTIASHPGMSPDHSQLAKKECQELLKSTFIENSDSQWACQAFYVNKKSEQVRENMKLVINY